MLSFNDWCKAYRAPFIVISILGAVTIMIWGFGALWDNVSLDPTIRRVKRIEQKVNEIDDKLDHINDAIDRYVPVEIRSPD